MPVYCTLYRAEEKEQYMDSMSEFKINTFSNIGIFREKNKNKNFENTYHPKLSSHNNYHIYYIYFAFQNSYSENSHYFQIYTQNCMILTKLSLVTFIKILYPVQLTTKKQIS